MNNYTIYCTEKQVRQAIELGAPVEYASNFNAYLPHRMIDFVGESGKMECAQFVIPSVGQMIGWLRAKGFKFILSDVIDSDEGNNWWVAINDKLITQGFNENKELGAIDAALEYLSNNNIIK